MSRHTWSDTQILEMLHLAECEGLTREEVARRFSTTKNAMVGLLGRINKATDESDPDGNQNGTMPERWWKR